MVQRCDRRPQFIAGAGTRWWRGPTEQSRRFIPAGAGNTLTYSTENHANGLSPLAREHGHFPKQTQEVNGLSPLAREPGFTSSRCWMWRFIPAGAGTPLIFLPPWLLRFIPAGAGNTEKSNSACKWGGRFIPAGAGYLRYFYLVSRGAVYPRWRRELSKSIHLFLKHFFP